MNPKLLKLENELFKKAIKKFFETNNSKAFFIAQRHLLEGLFLLPCKFENEKEKAYPLITNEKKESAIPLYLDFKSLSENLPVNEFDKVEILNYKELVFMLKTLPQISGIIVDFGSLNFYLKKEVFFDLAIFFQDTPLPSRNGLKKIESICEEITENETELFLDNLISFSKEHSYVKALWFYRTGKFWTISVKHTLEDESFFDEIQKLVPPPFGAVKIQNTRSALVLKEIKKIPPLYKKDS